MRFPQWLSKLLFQVNDFVLTGLLHQHPDLNESRNGLPHRVLNFSWIILALLLVSVMLSFIIQA
jgi:hypothetical protein